MRKKAITGGDWIVELRSRPSQVTLLTGQKRTDLIKQPKHRGSASSGSHGGYRRTRCETRTTRIGIRTHAKRCHDGRAHLDRWYLPYEGYYTNVLYTIKTVDDLVWKDSPTDHMAVIVYKGTQGKRGHDRVTINESVCEKIEVQRKIMELGTEAYSERGNPEKNGTGQWQ